MSIKIIKCSSDVPKRKAVIFGIDISDEVKNGGEE